MVGRGFVTGTNDEIRCKDTDRDGRRTCRSRSGTRRSSSPQGLPLGSPPSPRLPVGEVTGGAFSSRYAGSVFAVPRAVCGAAGAPLWPAVPDHPAPDSPAGHGQGRCRPSAVEPDALLVYRLFAWRVWRRSDVSTASDPASFSPAGLTARSPGHDIVREVGSNRRRCR